MTRHVVRRAVAAMAALLATALAVGVLPTGSVTVASAGEPDTPPKRIVTGWLPYWTTNASVASFLANADLFTEVSPFWHTLKWDSASQTVYVDAYPLDGGNTRSGVLAQLRGSGRSVVPSITDGTPAGRLAATLADPAQRAALVAAITATVTDNGYDGIDLDLEKFAFSDGRSTWPSTQPNWVAFVTALGAALHQRGKLLTVAIPPPCDVKGNCGGTNGYWVYSMDQIAPAVDRIRLMAYDYSWDRPGPIGPYWWTRAIARYAASVVPPAKVQIGAPSYGRNWVRRDAADVDGDGNTSEYLLVGDCPRSNATGQAEKAAYKSITATTAPDTVRIPSLLQARGNPDVQWDSAAKERWFRYSLKTNWIGDDGLYHACTAAREVWYNDAASALARAQLVDEFKLGGVAFWAVGGEDPAAWAKLRYYGRTLAPVPTNVAVQAPATTVYGQTVAVTATVTAAQQPVGGVTATLQWRPKGAAADAWTDVAATRTAADGTVAFAPRPTGTGAWRIQVAGSPVRLAGDTGAVATTSVRAAVTARLGRTSVPGGTAFRLYATVAPGTAGQPVRIQLLRAGSWRATATATVDAAGKVAVTLPSARSAGQWRYRVVSAATDALLPGYSPELLLTTTAPQPRGRQTR